MRREVLELDSEIADLRAIRQRLANALHAGCDSFTNCRCPASPQYVTRNDRVAQRGKP
jgi:hypothetical protein